MNIFKQIWPKLVLDQNWSDTNTETKGYRKKEKFQTYTVKLQNIGTPEKML